MEKKHTPRPWGVRKTASGNPFIYAGQLNVAGVAMVRAGVDSATAEANARLIAAAPEQNKALIDLLELVEELDCLAAANDPRAIAARSAIAKAIGTGDTK